MYYVYLGYRNEYVRGNFGGSYKVILKRLPKDVKSWLEATVREQFPDMEILQTDGSGGFYTVFGVDPSKRINVMIGTESDTWHISTFFADANEKIPVI